MTEEKLLMCLIFAFFALVIVLSFVAYMVHPT